MQKFVYYARVCLIMEKQSYEDKKRDAQRILSKYNLTASKFKLTSGREFTFGDSLFVGYFYIDVGKNVENVPEEAILKLQNSMPYYKVEFKDLSLD
jgi:hypothetical protein